jgi:hypothetical protein
MMRGGRQGKDPHVIAVNFTFPSTSTSERRRNPWQLICLFPRFPYIRYLLHVSVASSWPLPYGMLMSRRTTMLSFTVVLHSVTTRFRQRHPLYPSRTQTLTGQNAVRRAPVHHGLRAWQRWPHSHYVNLYRPIGSCTRKDTNQCPFTFKVARNAQASCLTLMKGAGYQTDSSFTIGQNVWSRASKDWK